MCGCRIPRAPQVASKAPCNAEPPPGRTRWGRQPARAPGDVAAVERAARQAIEIAEPAGMRPLLARACLVLGGALARAGRQPEAGAHLTSARALLESLG